MPNVPATWLNEFIVNLTVAGAQDDPDIIQLANGNILVSWTSQPTTLGATTDVIGQIFDPVGNRVGTEITLNTASTFDNERNSDLAALPGGGFIVVYHDDNSPSDGGSNIRLQEYSAAGVAVSDSPVVVEDSSTPSDPSYRNPVVAASSDTSVLIVYDEVSAGIAKTVGKIYNPATNVYGAQFDLITGGSVTGTGDSDVAVLTNGNYVIVSNRGDADTSIVYKVITSTGSNVVNSSFVTGTNSDNEDDRDATVTALTGGGFVIAWTNTDTDLDVIFRVYNAAGAEVNSGTLGVGSATNNNNEPVVRGLADGSFVIVYDNDELNRVDVEHFSAGGSSLGTFNFSGVSGTQLSATSLADGRFAVAWQSANGEIAMEILDTRNAPNDPGIYSPDQWVVGTTGDDVFTPNNNAEVTNGGPGNDTITESGNARQYFGGAGNDQINVVSGVNSDLHDGGEGVDAINWIGNIGNTGGVVFNLQAGTAVETAGDGGSTEQMTNFENLLGTNNADIIIGSFSKTFASNGGFIAVRNRAQKEYLKYYSATQTFSNALSPVQAASVQAAFDIVASQEGRDRRRSLLFRAWRPQVRLWTRRPEQPSPRRP